MKLDDIRCAADVASVREDLEFKVNEFLTTRGWKHTSSTPGSLWLWERTLEDGRTVLVNTDTAVHMEGWFEFVREAKVRT